MIYKYRSIIILWKIIQIIQIVQQVQQIMLF